MNVCEDVTYAQDKMSGKNPHVTCDWPPKQKCLKSRPGVRCAPIMHQEDRLVCSLPQRPDFAVDEKEPIVVQWPPVEQIGQGDCEVDTGIREDLLAKIPDQIISQVVTVPQVITVQGSGQSAPPIQHAKLGHPLCPDGQMHMEITPPQPMKTEIRIPDLGCAVRQPLRKWRQCIENTLINDRVRRPMAKWCHKRALPPLVIPKSEYQRLKDKCTETERKAAEKAERIRARECQRLESRKRMAQWNYTVESLLDRKKAQEEAQQKAESDGFKELIKEIKTNQDRHSDEKIARANKLLMYRKGLIQDFHSALAFSKMMQDVERSRQIDEDDDENEQTLPICEQKCMKRMLHVTDRPEYTKKKEKDKPQKVNERLLKTLVSIETRQKEQECEVNNQICDIKKLVKENMPELPETYLKHVKEPVCKENSSDDKFMKRREEFNDELDDKLAVDAYIESHEQEVERQACEYRKFFSHQKFIRKQTEERLIKEKVMKNIEKSEKAAAVLVAMKSKKQKESAHDYDALKEKWEEEVKEKKEEKKAQQEAIMEKVNNDFVQRQSLEKAKGRLRDASQQWAKEVILANENYEQECERKNVRRQKAEEIALYNEALAAEKKCQIERLKMLDNAWAEKVKGQYFEEMQQMKDYANDCIREWAGKGRSPIPMHMSMKKWETDSQMDPRMFREYERKKAAERKDDRGDADNFAEVIITSGGAPNICKKSTVQACDETTQSTSKRLGFC